MAPYNNYYSPNDQVDQVFEKPSPNTSRLLPLVFVLDSTVSMCNCDGVDQTTGKTRMDRLNATVHQVLKDVVSSSATASEVEVAFVVFTKDVVMYTDFKNPCDFSTSFFSQNNAHYFPCENAFQQVTTTTIPYTFDGAEERLVVPQFHIFPKATRTCMAAGVLKAIELIERRKDELESQGVQFYIPIMVTVTDGNTDQNGIPEEETRAQLEVYNHCFSKGNARNLIVPLFIGIGENANKAALNNYAKGYTRGLQIVVPNNDTVFYNKMKLLITKSLKKSISLNSWKLQKKTAEHYNPSRWSKQDQEPVYIVDQIM